MAGLEPEKAARPSSTPADTRRPCCSTCKQLAGSLDKFLPEDSRTILAWSKKSKNKVTGLRDAPEGNECNPCRVTRFNNYNAVSQAELNRLLQESGEAKAMWEQKRATNALPGRRGADQLDLQSFKKEEKYANFFDEGTVVTIDKFLKDNGYDFPPNATMSRKIAFVEQDLQTKIIYDNGVPCVAIMDGQRRVKIGTRQSVGKQRVAHHESGSAASSAYVASGADLSHLQETLRQQTEEAVRAKRMRYLNRDAMETAAPVEDGDSDAEDMAFSSLANPSSSSKGVGKAPDALRLEAGRSSPARSLSTTGGDGPAARMASANWRSLLPSQGMDHTDEDENPDAELADEEPDAPASANEDRPDLNPASKKKQKQTHPKKATGKDKVNTQKLQQLLSEKAVQFADSAMWDSKLKARAFDTAMKQMDALAEKVCSLDSPAAQQLVDQVCAFMETTRKKFNAFSLIRKWNDFLADGIDGATMAILKSVEPPVLAQIFMWISKEVIKNLEQEDIRVAQFFKLLSFQHADGGNNFCLRVYLDAIGPRAEGSQAMKAADSVQMQMVGSFWERLFRCKDEGKLRAMVQLLPAPELDGADLTSEFKAQTSDAASPPVFCNLVRMELHAARVMLKSFGEDGSEGTALDNVAAKAVTEAKRLLSEKFQNFLKLGLAKKLWARAEQAGRRCISSVALLEQCRSCKDACPKEPLAATTPLDFLTAVLSASDAADLYVAAAGCAETVEATMPADDMEPDVGDLRVLIAQIREKVDLHVNAVFDEFAAGFANNEQQVSAVMNVMPVSQHLALKSMWKLARAFKVQSWERVTEKMIDTAGKAVQEAAAMLRNIESMQEMVTVEGFVKASVLIYRVGTSKEIKSFGDQLRAGEKTGELPACLLGLGKALAQLAVGESRGAPTKWFKQLVADGALEQFASVDASTRSKFGIEVEKHLRALDYVRAWKTPDAGTGFGVIFLAEVWETKNHIQEGMVSLFDLLTYMSSEDRAEIPDMTNAMEALAKRAGGTMASLQRQLSSARAAMKENTQLKKCQQLSALLTASPDTITDDVKTMIGAYNRDEDTGSSLKKLVTCCDELQSVEELANYILGWEADLQESTAVPDDAVQALKTAISEEPTAKSVRGCIYDVMTADLLLRPRDNPAQLLRDINGFQKFASNGLKFAKKDAPSVMSSRLEELSQDLKKVKNPDDKKASEANMPPPSQSPQRRRSKKAP